MADTPQVENDSPHADERASGGEPGTTRPSRRARTAVAVLAASVVGLALVGGAVVGVVAFTSLQETHFRWIGLAGVALPVSFALAVLATAAAVATMVALARSVGPRRWFILLVVLPLWVLVVSLAWPTLHGFLAPRPAQDGVAVDLVVQNLWYRNPDPGRTVRRLLDLDPDVLVLVEYTPQHAAAFRAAGADDSYPYRWEAPQDHGSGIAVLSKVRIGGVTPLRTQSVGATMRLEAAGAGATLSVVHPISPKDRWGLLSWIKDYQALDDELADASPDTVVAGDFNATGAHLRYRRLLENSGLVDAQDVSGSGFGATWPATRGIPPLMRLDRVLVGEAIGVDGVSVLGPMGADHRGVLVRLRLPASRS